MHVQRNVIQLPIRQEHSRDRKGASPGAHQGELAAPISWRERKPRDHFVQFYEDEDFLAECISGFLGAGLGQGEAAIIIATPGRRAEVEARLEASGLNCARLAANGHYVALDAADTLAKFMAGDMPDPQRFDTVVGNRIREAAKDGRRVRAFGEMVAELWKAGSRDAAIRLEELWNDLGEEIEFCLFCAYPMSALCGTSNREPLQHVCSRHTHVIPAESYTRETDKEEQLRAIALLQQKAISFEAEIAERKQAECSLRQEQTRLAMAVAVAQLGIWELDLVSNELRCSEQCKAHYGLKPHDNLTYDRLFQLIHPDDREKVRDALRNAVENGADHSSEYRVLHPTGRARWICSVGRCFHNGEHRLLGVTLDISDRKEAAEILEQTVAERTAKLKETLGELESFSYSISHDMRAPLRSMQGFASILMEDWAKQITPEARVCLERINASAQQMDRLIQDVLTFSRVARSDFKVETVDLATLIHGIVDSHADLQAIKSNILIEGRLPVVLGNPAGLTQCLSNLLANSAKFVAQGVTPRIRIWTEPHPDPVASFIRLNVQDNGIGISPESHEKIFEIFHRLSKKYDGTGIGLAIVKKAVERMGGRVGLRSAPGEGSTFWLDLRVPAR